MFSRFQKTATVIMTVVLLTSHIVIVSPSVKKGDGTLKISSSVEVSAEEPFFNIFLS